MIESPQKSGPHAGSHGIEVANFAINFALPIDHVDMRRFNDKEENIKKIFHLFNDRDSFDKSINSPSGNRPPPKADIVLAYIATNGEREWTGLFGNNKIVVSCHKYTKWEEVWPSAKKRLQALLECLDPCKPVHSMDYYVTDTYIEKLPHEIQDAPDSFPMKYVSAQSSKNRDPRRRDFIESWFDNYIERDHVLERLAARSGIHENNVITSISNLQSQKFKSEKRAQELISVSSSDSMLMENVFNKFHREYEYLVEKILVHVIRNYIELNAKASKGNFARDFLIEKGFENTEKYSHNVSHEFSKSPEEVIVRPEILSQFSDRRTNFQHVFWSGSAEWPRRKIKGSTDLNKIGKRKENSWIVIQHACFSSVHQKNRDEKIVDLWKLCNEYDAYSENSKMLHELREAFSFARQTFEDLNKERLRKAYIEATILVASGLFGDKIVPSISVDPYGEFTFSHKSKAGYVDIGVRGEGELSYHVRNDIDPKKTEFDDYEWIDFAIPQPLRNAMMNLRTILSERGI